ncbi:MAG: NAD-dependent epimerase/dehydratase family protein [Desulfobacterales bacterium]|nr:NAD-dependent epimerase/dehydratase family protein [Desulfobacterales bacterium]
MKNILVTGGGGFLGKAIIRELLNSGKNITSFSRQFYSDLDGMGVKQIQGDLADPHAVSRAVEGMDTVFHVAAKAGVWGSYDSYHRINVLGTENVIQACMDQGRIPLIHTSSPSVVFDENDMEGVDESVPYPDNYLTHYPATKALAEQRVIAASKAGLPSIILRPHLIWGPGDNHLIPRIIQRGHRLRRIGRRDDRVDTIYVDNAAHAHVLAAQCLEKDVSLSGNVYFISQDDPISKWELVDAFLAAGGKPPVKGHISAKAAYAVGWILEKVYGILKIKSEPPMTRFVAKELATSHWFDISRVKRDLGYQPRVSTAEGLKRVGEWLSREKM